MRGMSAGDVTHWNTNLNYVVFCKDWWSVAQDFFVFCINHTVWRQIAKLAIPNSMFACTNSKLPHTESYSSTNLKHMKSKKYHDLTTHAIIRNGAHHTTQSCLLPRSNSCWWIRSGDKRANIASCSKTSTRTDFVRFVIFLNENGKFARTFDHRTRATKFANFASFVIQVNSALLHTPLQWNFSEHWKQRH